MNTDRELLLFYSQESSETAFAELVKRHVNLVYAVALRQLCGNTALAEDVVQAVFTALAAKAASPTTIHSLPGWLYTTTRFTVSHTVRAERRRQDREQKAQTMHALIAEPGTPESPDVPAGLVDEVLESLEECDREAILLRYFEGQSFPAIALAMGTTEDAVRMRVNRTLERIRNLYSRKGITSSATAIGEALASHAVAAPAALAENAAAAALAASGAIMATSGAALGTYALATTAKTASWIAGGVALMALAYSLHEHRSASALREKVTVLANEQVELRAALDRSEQRSKAFDEEATLAARRNADLQRNLDAAVAAKSVQAPRIPAKGMDPQTVERLARMKPLLENGMPIKGAFIVLQEGKPVQHPVQFVMGKEIRIEAGDDGTYVVTPTLNPDGTVKYSMQLQVKDPSGGPDKTLSCPFMIQTPWEGFTISVENGGVIAFDPDPDGP